MIRRGCFMAGLLILMTFGGCSPRDPEVRELLAQQPETPVGGRLEYYTTHSRVTDPGRYAAMFEGVPAEVESIVGIVQGLIINDAQKRLLGVTRNGDRDWGIRRVENMLKQISWMDPRSVVSARAPENRLHGSCRHFAVMTCALLRHAGIPARARGGFETYFSSRAHHDHWICEYWKAEESRWVRVDAEIDDLLRAKWKVDFDTSDLPDGTFMTGAEAWILCRGGTVNPKMFGVGGSPGEWVGGLEFVLDELVLDYAALNKIELLPWDGGHVIDTRIEGKSEEELAEFDEMARAVQSAEDNFDAFCAGFRQASASWPAR